LIKRCQFEFAALQRHKGDIELLSYYMYCPRPDETSGSDDSSKDARRRLVSSDHIQPLSMIVDITNTEPEFEVGKIICVLFPIGNVGRVTRQRVPIQEYRPHDFLCS